MQIYKTTDLKTGKIYIGQEKNNNPEYFGSGLIIRNVIHKRIKDYIEQELCKIFEEFKFKKYKRNYCNLLFSKEILEENFIDKEDLNLAEKFWILNYQSQNPEIGYNIASGGFGGDLISCMSKEAKLSRSKKISEKLKNKPKSEKHKINLSKAKKNKPLSENHKKNISKASLICTNYGMKNKHHKKESTIKISFGLKNSEKFHKVLSSKEYKKNMSKATIGEKNGRAQKYIIKKNNEIIECILYKNVIKLLDCTRNEFFNVFLKTKKYKDFELINIKKIHKREECV